MGCKSKTTASIINGSNQWLRKKQQQKQQQKQLEKQQQKQLEKQQQKQQQQDCINKTGTATMTANCIKKKTGKAKNYAKETLKNSCVEKLFQIHEIKM